MIRRLLDWITGSPEPPEPESFIIEGIHVHRDPYTYAMSCPQHGKTPTAGCVSCDFIWDDPEWDYAS